MKFSINQVALAALLVAVAAIMAVSTISVNALQNLIEANANLARIQRIVSSLALIRFHALSANNSAQAYVITGDSRDLASYLTGTVVMRAEAKYPLENNDIWLASSTTANTAGLVKTRHAFLNVLIKTEKKIVDVRADEGFIAAQTVMRGDKNELAKDLVVANSDQMLVDAREMLA